ncbi:hypothetical protein CDD81_6815 [Ophiocordyceps australis]|uniref:Uncharacterized protein n=1 Tax=Ophiocordyceps australis TaxID=1399860 RepID=A0A2C5X9A0_9HYPO|nr:hypothetical protein CDD81_6815 [Ophiocordyceps australis]
MGHAAATRDIFEHAHLAVAGAPFDFAEAVLKLSNIMRQDWRYWEPYSDDEGLQITAAGDWYVEAKNGTKLRGLVCLALGRQTYLAVDTGAVQTGCRIASEAITGHSAMGALPCKIIKSQVQLAYTLAQLC